jgi:peptidoglycan/LPS O-acetylase OafA/YrhL
VRIFPAYWLALVVLVAATSEQVDGVRQWLQYLTLTQAYRSDTALGALPHTWSLGAELAFYAALPAYAWAVARASRRVEAAPWLGIAGLVTASLAYHGVLELSDPSWKAVALLWMPAHLEMFAIGIALAELSVRSQGSPALRGRLERWGQPDLAWLALAVAAYATVSLALDLPKGLEPFSGRQLFARQVLYATVTVGLLVPAVFGDADRGPVRRLLRWRPVVWVGLVSYGVYLWHKSLSIEVVDLTGGDHERLDGNFWLAAGVLAAVTVAIAGASRRLWEEPIARRWSNRFDRSRSRRS